jgi:hypothetical protein
MILPVVHLTAVHASRYACLSSSRALYCTALLISSCLTVLGQKSAFTPLSSLTIVFSNSHTFYYYNTKTFGDLMKNSSKCSSGPGESIYTDFLIRTLELVLDVPSFRRKYGIDPVIHALDQIINIFLRNCLSGLYYYPGQFIIGLLRSPHLLKL